MSGYAEAIRRLRVALDQSLCWRGGDQASATGEGKVIMVGSTVPGEGKSNTALALGRTYAGSGLRTLLIDCDLRKPRIHHMLGAEPDASLMHYLTGAREAGDCENMCQPDHATALEIILGAGRSNSPADQLLVGPRFSALLESCRASFDIIILDTPPLLPLVDGLYLARSADAITLVVKWASTTRQDVRSVLPALFDAKKESAAILCALNQERRGRLDYYKLYTSYYGKPKNA